MTSPLPVGVGAPVAGRVELLGLLAALLLPAGAFALAFFVGRPWLAVLVLVPLASLGAALVLSVEAALGLIALGHLFERLDISTELGN